MSGIEDISLLRCPDVVLWMRQRPHNHSENEICPTDG